MGKNTKLIFYIPDANLTFIMISSVNLVSLLMQGPVKAFKEHTKEVRLKLKTLYSLGGYQFDLWCTLALAVCLKKTLDTFCNRPIH